MTELISIVAKSENNIIADKNGIPWNYPDKKQYKSRIHGQPLVAGRKTYETMLQYEKELLTKSNIAVLTTDESYVTPIKNHSAKNSKQQAINWISNQKSAVYNIGGGDIYSLLLDETDTLIISEIPQVVSGTVKFPTINYNNWNVVSIEDFGSFEVYTYNRTN